MTFSDRAVPASRPEYSAALLLILAGVATALAITTPNETMRLGFSAAAAGFGFVFLGRTALRYLRSRVNRKLIKNMALLVEHDVTPCLVTDVQGQVISANREAAKTFRAAHGQMLRDI
ncbi:hypothetical protein, partial [Marivita sp.]